MRKNNIQSIIPHIPDNIDSHALSDEISKFHFEIIERRLKQSNLTTGQQITVINKIIENMKSQKTY